MNDSWNIEAMQSEGGGIYLLARYGLVAENITHVDFSQDNFTRQDSCFGKDYKIIGMTE